MAAGNDPSVDMRESSKSFIESLQGHTDRVLEKEKWLLAAGYDRMFLSKAELLRPGEYLLRSSYGFPVKILFWCKS